MSDSDKRSQSNDDPSATTPPPLRSGWTTGACATAAVKAAFTALLTGAFPDPVSIRLPKGEQPVFPLSASAQGEGWAKASIVKDAGDDPDVTHLALIEATLRQGKTGSGIIFKAGKGVGIVTKPGLPLAVGEPAINPVPRQMMREVVLELAKIHGAATDLEIEISVPNGERLAEKTLNPRLGILGGISILGTTGIVRPFSCSAWIASIHRGIDVIRAEGIDHAAACTGQTSEKATREKTGLPDSAFIDMGDFVGATLKYLRSHPIKRLTLGGGFGKFSKLALGYLDLHSGRSRLDMTALAQLAAKHSNATGQRAQSLAKAHTALEAFAIAKAAGIDLAAIVAAKAKEVALLHADGKIDIEILIFDREGILIGEKGFSDA